MNCSHPWLDRGVSSWYTVEVQLNQSFFDSFWRFISHLKGGETMKYTKPVVLEPKLVQAAKCGDGPCGRPCSKNKA